MQDWARKIAGGDTRALARAATAIENGDPRAQALLAELATLTGRARVVGVTGPPGAGKSTLVDQFARLLRRSNRTVGIIAVDPTSPVSGGAILGDRIRMQSHHGDPGVFIRSMATRGASGGIAKATADLVKLLDASGKDYVIIETVGAGQAEVEVARLASITVLVLVPGMGDDIQALKAGIMEIADVFVINKADHPGADQLERQIRGVLDLERRPERHAPPIVRTVATEGAGIDQLIQAVEQAAPHARKPSSADQEFKIDHLGVAVNSIDEALRFYRDQLGMPVSLRESVPQERVRLAMLPASGPRIELLEPEDGESVIAKFLEKRGPGLHHVAIRVPDLQATLERLRAAGARLLNAPQPGAGGHIYVFVHPSSTGGVLLELIQDEERSR